MPTASAILDAFERLGWKNNDPMTQVLQLRREDPKALGELVTQLLDRSMKHATFIDAALDLMDDDTYAATLNAAWQRDASEQDATALSEILDSGALQMPAIFGRDWSRLLTASQCGQGGPRFHLDYAWRALDAATAHAWLNALEDDVSEGTPGYHRAMALLYSRQPAIVLAAWQRLFPDTSGDSAIAWLMLAGYARERNALRALHSEQPLHIGLSAEQRDRMQAGMPPWRRQIHQAHPTWQSDAPAIAPAHMGGALSSTCGLCHAPLHRLLALPQPERAGIPCNTPLEFGTCLSCQGWESDGALFFRHDAHGVPYAHPRQRREVALTPEFPARPLLAADIHLFAAPARWQWQDWGESNHRQNLNRLGGAPSWVQSAWYPDCPDCNTKMRFAMQLDSDLPTQDGGDWSWGSGGCNYTFWCAACRVSAHEWQCT